MASNENNVLVLSARDLRALADWPTAIAASRAAYAHASAGTANSPVRMRLPLADGARFATMPGADLAAQALGVKLVGYYPGNPGRGLPRVTGAYVLVDPLTGLALAIIEGASLTNLRTAAGGIVAAQTLAAPGWRHLGIIGSGGLATLSAEGFLASGDLASIAIYSRTPANAERFAESLRRASNAPMVRACTSAEAVVREAQVIVCGTDTHTPLFDGTALGDGRLVISLGANTPSTRELDAVAMTRGRIFVDSRAAVMAECGEILIAQQEGKLPPDPPLTELGTVLNGQASGRTGASETLVFLSTGLAAQDALTARALYDRAIARGIGARAALYD